VLTPCGTDSSYWALYG